MAARLGKKIREGRFSSFGQVFTECWRMRVAATGGDGGCAYHESSWAFLRERAHFDFLTHTILPGLPTGVCLNIWSAASSSGEEPYWIACSLLAVPGFSSARFQILATDISTRALKKAREATYTADRFRDFPPNWRQQFLVAAGEGEFRIKPEVVSRVEFRRLNLMEPIQHGRRFQVIFCRNVMIYFDRPTQEAVVNRLRGCLEPGGYLFVGHSETLTGMDHGLEYVKPAIYRNGKARMSRTGS